jgi:carboxyl-terminal processing protease
MPAGSEKDGPMTKKRSSLFAMLLAASAIMAAPVQAQGARAQAADPDYAELEKFMEVYGRIKATYVRDVTDKELVKGAIDGMLNALDPHSSYAEASDYDDLSDISTGNYGGLGIISTIDGGAVRVVSPTEDTPAWQAGIKAGDYITRIGGELTYGLSLQQAIDKMRGPPGSKVDLKIVRPGRDAPFTVSVTRAVITANPVKWEVKDGVGIINLNRFTGTSGDQVQTALSEIDKATGNKTVGYVLDLRSNGGGVLEEAVQVADLFLERGEIVSQRGRSKESIERFYAKPGDVTGGKPVIVLVDSGSASASEIVAGAIQEHRRGLVFGERSFGKGSVQSVVPLGPRTALRLTTDLYYLPSGRSVQEGGIIPDIVVPQLSDPDYSTRDQIRETDLRRHLIAEGVDDLAMLEEDTSADPRFNVSQAELAKLGVRDFQLDYSVKTLKRIEMAAKAGLAPGKV